MKQSKDNQYGYSSWTMEDVLRYARFLFLPLLVIILIAVILVVDKKKNPQPEESYIAKSTEQGEAGEETAVNETESMFQEPVRIFTANGVPEVAELLNQYFTAKQNADAETIYRLFGWTGELGLEELRRQLQYDARYTDGYRNIVCYTAPGEIEGTYLVCVSYDLKFKNSLTLAPGFQWSYVRTGMDGNLYLTVEDELGEPEKAFIEEALKADEIVLLRIEIYAKLRSALESDPSLAEGYGILEKKGGSAGANQQEAQHEANVQIDGISVPAEETEESPSASEEPDGSGTGTAEAGMIHIEGSSISPESAEGASEEVPGTAGDSSVSLPENSGAAEAAAGSDEAVPVQDGAAAGNEAAAGTGAE